MAKFLNGPGAQAALVDIITNSEKNLWIISPYLKIPIQTKNYLKSIDIRNVNITIIYRKDEKIYHNDQDRSFFKELKHLDLRCCENLHTKCFLNDKEGLISSMNLYEFSQTHNWEMGIYFSRQTDQAIWNDVIKELELLRSHALHHIDDNAFCIRCGKPMEEFDPNKPLCKKCYAIWAKWGNKQRQENHCHSCGNESTDTRLSFEKPLCQGCAAKQQRK